MTHCHTLAAYLVGQLVHHMPRNCHIPRPANETADGTSETATGHHSQMPNPTWQAEHNLVNVEATHAQLKYC